MLIEELFDNRLTIVKIAMHGNSIGTFGNDPRKEYALEPYRQYGEPRMVGLYLSYDLTESR